MNPIGTVSAETVATNVIDAIRQGRAYVFTDDHHTVRSEPRQRSGQISRDRTHRVLNGE
jgi:hypothetical protein